MYRRSPSLSPPNTLARHANDTVVATSAASVAAAASRPHGVGTARATVTDPTPMSVAAAPPAGSRKRRYNHTSKVPYARYAASVNPTMRAQIPIARASALLHAIGNNAISPTSAHGDSDSRNQAAYSLTFGQMFPSAYRSPALPYPEANGEPYH